MRPLPAGISSLPIAEILPELVARLNDRGNLVLQAPPGAGKTTGVPLALLGAGWLDGRKIVMLEPRRLAARAAARRMAALLGETVGETVGYRVRMESRVGPRTRIEIVTDGVFTRMIQGDPTLERVGAVLFDEFHERRIETDLGLALTLDLQRTLRPELRLIAMSATLNAGPVAALMDDAPILTAQGRAYPVTLRYLSAPPSDHMAGAVADTVIAALDAPGDILVFLPGGGEIRRVQRFLADRALPPTVDVLPLYGDLDQAGQDRAIAPAPLGCRKIVLATSIAETSLTIEGVTQVVDCGLSRTAVHDPRSGMTRLETGRASQAETDQRAGRAGRTAPGLCWRLWPEAAQKSLPPRPRPEIALADLTPLALELAAWGIGDPARLPLLDPPNLPAFAAARRLLGELEALDATGRITAHGRRMAVLGLPPRLAHMVLKGHEAGHGPLAVAIAAVLSERGESPGGADLRGALELMATPPGSRQREVARRLARQAGIEWQMPAPARAGAVLALAYPDRIALRRPNGRFVLSGGAGAMLPANDPLAGEQLLAVADLDGKPPDSRIWLAAPLDEAELEAAFGAAIVTEEIVQVDPVTSAVKARRRRRFGALVLDEAPIAAPSAEAHAAALLDFVRHRGVGVLPWTEEAEALRARVRLMAAIDGADAWPRLDDEALAETLDNWLAPALSASPSALDLAELLRAQLDDTQRRRLDRETPSHIVVPSGSRIPIDYRSGDQPVLAVKLQELFGLAETPSIAGGRIRLLLHLLSPAQRPIQVTGDLPGFWAGSYQQVRSEMRGRYPRHPWPENPLEATPTARAKPRR